jgi:hypothetical protein
VRNLATSPAILLAALFSVALASNAARGDESVPGGHLYVGLGAEVVRPFGRALVSREPLGAGFGSAWHIHYEGEWFLVAAELAGGSFRHDDTYSNPVMLAVRGGPVFGSGRYAPYLSIGIAALAYGAIFDDAASATGFTAEAGLLLFRQLRWFRATAFAQYNVPVHSTGGKGSENVTSLSWGAVGLRVEL